MTYTIGELAKKFHLSRGTLLYYSSIGLLPASSRTDSNYRQYTEEDVAKLQQISMYRQAGLSLKDIQKILDSEQSLTTSILEKRLHDLNDEIRKLRNQQYVIVTLLKNEQLLERIGLINKETWVALLHSVGFDDITAHRWHIEFEKLSPQEHQDFLESLGLPFAEIQKIREWSTISDPQ